MPASRRGNLDQRAALDLAFGFRDLIVSFTQALFQSLNLGQ
jgi:hypothetical protein